MVTRYAQDILAGKYKLPISWLHKQAYCEYQIYLEYVREEEVGETAAMARGSKAHAQLDAAHFAVAKLLPLEEALEKSVAEQITCIYRDLRVENNTLAGRIDELQIGPSQITIVDDKPIKRRVYPPDVRQVWGYCVAYEDQHKPDRSLQGAIRDRDKQEIVWKKQFTSEARTEVETSVARILGILKQERQAEPTAIAPKCRPCRFKPRCDKSLA